jgi:hypothetical protein
MKNNLKNYVITVLLLFGISLVLVNCEKETVFEDGISSLEGMPKIQVKTVNLAELQQKETLSKKLQGIAKVLDVAKNNQKSGITSNDGSFTILTDEIVEVTTDATEAYTFRIETPTDSTAIFENFVIEKVADTYRFWIYRFFENESGTEDTESPPYQFTKQRVTEEAINASDLLLFTKDYYYYEAETGCLFFFYYTNPMSPTENAIDLIFCPEPDNGGPAITDNDGGDTSTGGNVGSSGGGGGSPNSDDPSNNDNPYGDGPQGGGDSTGNANPNTDNSNNTDPPQEGDNFDNPNSPVAVLPIRCALGFTRDANGNCVIETIFNTEGLTTEQQTILDEAINTLSENCLGAALLDVVRTVNISMGGTTFAGQYNPDNNTISFRNNNDISSDILGAELMHAYQQQLYGILDDIKHDNTNNHKGGSNIEFEEKAFNIKKDMIDGGGMFTFPGEEELTDWLIDLDINHPTGTIELSSSELSAWFAALEAFQQHHESNPDFYGAPIDYNLKPDAIINLINKILDSNCN